ncbi:down syndrome cell adhesion molecule-like protein Dscam2, partial [Caerostris extrusa]
MADRTGGHERSGWAERISSLSSRRFPPATNSLGESLRWGKGVLLLIFRICNRLEHAFGERKSSSHASARDYRPISTSYHHQIFENGSLTIQDVTEEDAGYYLCQATNGIGPGLSSVVTLSAN